MVLLVKEDPESEIIERVRSARRGELVALRSLRTPDIDNLVQFNLEPEIGILHSGDAGLRSEHDQLEHFRSWAVNTDTQAGMAIESLSDHPEMVGALHIRTTGRRDGAGRLGMLLGPDYRGRGYGSDALRLAIALAFDDLGLHRLEWEALAANLRSHAIAERCGFRLEGRRREVRLIAGRREDTLLYGLLKSERNERATVPGSERSA